MRWLLLAALLGIISACTSPLLSSEERQALATRPDTWAQAVIAPHLKNCYRIDAKLYRCAQLNKEGMTTLAGMGVKELLNLRELHSDTDVADGRFALHRVKINAGSISEQQIIDALKIIKSAQAPIMVHCWHGADRTGAVIAAYRVVIQNWSKSDALNELVNGGYGYHSIYSNIIKTIEALDVDAARRTLGVFVGGAACTACSGNS